MASSISFGALRAAIVALSLLFGVSTSAKAQTYGYTSGHGDFRVSYDAVNKEFLPHIHLDGGATYAADQVVIQTDVARTTLATNPASVTSFAGMLGIGAGEQIWVLGGSGVGPYLGFSGEGLNAADWTHTFPNPYTGDPFSGAAIHLELTGWSMPEGGEFGVYSTSGLPATWGNRSTGEVIFSTYDPGFTLNNNKLSVIVDDHTHYAFGFTKPGDYYLEFTFSSVYQGTESISTPATFHFQVIPEPSSALLIVGVGLGLAAFRFRRRFSERKNGLMGAHVLAVTALVLALATPPAQAEEPEEPEEPFYYTSGHADIRPGAYDPGTQQFQPNWHFDGGVAPQEVYAPDEAIAVIAGSRSAPNGGLASATEIFGLLNGPIYIAGSSAYQPNLGFSTGDLNAADWEEIDFGGIGFPAVTATLTNWSGPGEFALYSTNLAGTEFIDIYFSSLNPGLTNYDNTLEIIIPGHDHYTWGFSAPGYYELEITWEGTHVTDGFISTTAVYGFHVIPEPSVLWLSAIALVGFAWRRIRQRTVC